MPRRCRSRCPPTATFLRFAGDDVAFTDADIHLRCVAAVQSCKGRMRVGIHGLTAPVRFSIGVGKRATLTAKLSPAQLRGARHDQRFASDGLTVGVNVVTTDPDGRTHILDSALSGSVR